MLKTTGLTGNNDYSSNGVSISPSTPEPGEKAKLVYNGLLAKSGARSIYAHVGFGNSWLNTGDYQMTKTGNTFETMISVSKADTMHVCFKDGADNWDNNSGKNYVFNIQ